MTRALSIILVGAGVSIASQASAQQLQWQHYDYEDANGQPMADVVYGIPQTDATLFTAHCTASAPDDIIVHLNVDPGPNQGGARVELTVVIGDRNEVRNATIIDGPEGRYTEVILAPGDSLWETLMAGRAGTMSVRNGAWSDFHLRGSRAAISRFLASCDAFAAAGAQSGGVAGGEPLTGPLYLISGGAAPLLSDFRGGAEIATLAPGTEVMATNSYGSFNGVDWMEVVTDRGLGPAGWVDRGLTVPTTGGAAEYQNLNQVANLVIRSQPSRLAPTVGAIPPLATGIVDQGALDGGWVLVRYGNTVGWASHEYLLPILGAGESGTAGGASGQPSGYQEATYGSWHMECDPCRHPEDGATCQIGALTGPLAVHFFEGDDRPIHLLYYPSRDLHEPEASTMTLRMVVDGETIAILTPPAWNVYEMTGEVGIQTFGNMIAAMRNGHALTLTLEGPTGTMSDSVALDGFAEAQDAMLAIFPVENAHLTGQSCPNL